ncbi:hypothetical protein TraAM80_00882 [Trypanosoma rangeli]|uniref:SB domain-containing protein n=1 Tax=Trypanosoma rangeli TaxID=5698 RepID=A0A422P1H3_TRYRA|nr:uncharacterized protein TraAM80_00882 [Trypanosoma rangeli]RNF11549.1 hypothetical protein TraAM80_00882 [Trypanosoma rangeli]|eukprot:RNF11549.1 hypothetical protein TraAM80_00882 [Trypanosoma rangeli]
MGEEELRRCILMGNLREHYSQAAATEINKYVGDFMAYLNNFGTIRSSFSMKDNQTLLVLQCPLFVTPPQSGDTGDQRSNKELPPLLVEVYFPLMFPSVPPCCSVVAEKYRHKGVEKWSIRQPSRVVASNGSVYLSELSLLSGATPPYSLLEILLALTEQFELEFPLISAHHEARDGVNNSTHDHRARLTNMSNEHRNALEKKAAEALMLHLLSKAEGYLDTREQSLTRIARLYKCGGAVREARGLLEEKRSELLPYSLEVEKVEKLVEKFTQLSDNLEVHSTCIVPVDDLQARALELLSEIHALDDVLELLERSLKAGQLSCEEYVRRVSDIGRKQFEARFLFARVAEAVNRVRAKTGQQLPITLPRATSKPAVNDGFIQVPTKLNNVDLLLREFPEVGSEMVKAVLNVVDGSVSDARVQLRAMLS